MNLAKLIVPDINVGLKVRVARVWFEWGTLCVWWDAWCDAGTSILPACLGPANNLILRLHRALQCGSDAELCFKTKQDVGRERGSGSSSSASEAGAARQGQGSALYFSGALGALPMAPWKWPEYLFRSPLDGCQEKNGTTFFSSNCY